MGYGIIYVVRNKMNGKLYVGQTTTDAQTRWRWHRKARTGWPLHHAIAKYGHASFEVDTVDAGEDKTELDAKEQLWIAKLNSVSPNGYNLQLGGSRGLDSDSTRAKKRAARLGKTLSPETRAKISQAKTGKKRPPEAIEKTRQANLGQVRGPLSADHKEKLRQANLGKCLSSETRTKISTAKTGTTQPRDAVEKTRQANLGRHHTDEAKEKIRRAITGTIRTDEEKTKNRNAHLGRNLSASTREKISRTQRGVPKSPEHRERISKAVRAARLRGKIETGQPYPQIPPIMQMLDQFTNDQTG